MAQQQPRSPQQHVQPPPPQIEPTTELTALLTWYIKDNKTLLSGHEEMMRNTNVTIRNLEHHMVQMSKLIEERLPGFLPSNTRSTPRSP